MGLAVVGALALLASSPAPAAAALTLKLRCPGAGGKTIVRTSQARVFTRVSPYFREPGNPDYYGCLYRRKTAFRISLIDYYGVVVQDETIRAAGRYVALVQDRGSADLDAGDDLVVRDLVSGRAVYAGPRRRVGEVTDLVVKPNGVAAFIYERGPVREVRLTRLGGDSVVNQGPDLDPTSLELSPDGRSVTYLKAGQRRSTPIP